MSSPKRKTQPLTVIRNGKQAGTFAPKVGMRLRNDFEILEVRRGQLKAQRPDRGTKTILPGTRDYSVTFREAHRYGFSQTKRKSSKKTNMKRVGKKTITKPAESEHQTQAA